MRTSILAAPGVLILIVLTGPHAVLAQYAQQGDKLVGSGATGLANQGSVAIAADGDTVLIGGADDHSAAGGAVWVFTRGGEAWSQQGAKLVGTGGVGGGDQGGSVAISADGNTGIEGAWADSSNSGAAWVFTRGPSRARR